MLWSPKQEYALKSVSTWLANGASQVFYLAGFAGTGKTTLAVHLAQGVPGKVFFAAHTGKAASVMRERGCKDALTIHQLIYQPSNKSKAELRKLTEELDQRLAELPAEDREHDPVAKRLKFLVQQENKKLKQPGFSLNTASPLQNAKLAIIDECSMVDETMGRDLLSFGVPILVLGDPAQLPPIKGGGFFTAQKPDILLDEIHRQAEGNPIIELATKVRNGERLSPGTYGESLIIRGERPDPQLVLGTDQVIVGRNATRRGCNRRLRELLGRAETWHPVAGDRLVCLRNHHEAGLLNGTTWNTINCDVMEGMDEIGLDLEDDNGSSLSALAHPHFFQGREDELSHWQMQEAECFDFGYALTAHKAQGSQWQSVCIFDESHVFRGSSREWLYTAITRASERVLIVQ